MLKAMRCTTMACAMITTLFAGPRESQAFFHRLFGCCSPAYRPVVAYAAPAPSACAPCTQTVSYVPQTSYYAVCENVPVTTCRATTSCDPCTGCPVTVMRPVTTYVRRARYVPVTTYRAVYQPVTCAAPACCPTSCDPCSSMGTASYTSTPSSSCCTPTYTPSPATSPSTSPNVTPQPSLSSPPQQTYQSDRPATNGYNGQNNNGQNNNSGSNGGGSNGAVTPIAPGSNTRSTNGWQMQAPQLINPRDQMTERSTNWDGNVVTVSAATTQLRTASRPVGGAPVPSTASDLEIADAEGWESMTTD